MTDARKPIVILGCDPGPDNSAFVVLRNGEPGQHGWWHNEKLLDWIKCWPGDWQHLAIETLHPRAEPVSLLAMQAQLWAGRFIEAAGVEFTCVDERDARFEATGNPSAATRDVRLGLLNIFGEDKQERCDCTEGQVPGKKPGTLKKCPRCKGERFVKAPGPLATFNEHERSALAVAYRVWQRKFLAQAKGHGFGAPLASSDGGA